MICCCFEICVNHPVTGLWVVEERGEGRERCSPFYSARNMAKLQWIHSDKAKYWKSWTDNNPHDCDSSVYGCNIVFYWTRSSEPLGMQQDCFVRGLWTSGRPRPICAATMSQLILWIWGVWCVCIGLKQGRSLKSCSPQLISISSHNVII